MNALTSIAIGVVIVILVIGRQMMKRSVRGDRQQVIMLVLFVVGLYDVGEYLHTHTVSSTAILMTVASLIIAGVLGGLRAYTVRLWRDSDGLWQQGTIVTILLWVLSIAVHFGADFLIGGGSAAKGLATTTMLLYVAVTFGIQQLIVRGRAARLAVAG